MWIHFANMAIGIEDASFIYAWFILIIGKVSFLLSSSMVLLVLQSFRGGGEKKG